MKKVLALLFCNLIAAACFAQFEQGKYYIGASLSGLDLNYSGAEKLNLGVDAKGGYLVDDNWMVLAQAGYHHYGDDDVADVFVAGVGGRYYIIQNGLYLGLNAKLIHANRSYNDIMPGLEMGYAFFLNNSVTIEPAIYYDQSFKSHKDYSKIGFRIGVGVYI